MSDAISKRLKKSQEFLDALIERFDLENSRKGFSSDSNGTFRYCRF